MLLDKRLSYKPFEYQWAYDYWYKQNAAHWMRTEVDMSKDLKDWKEKLTIEEKEVVGGILKSFAQCYDEQTEILTDSGWKFFKDLSYIDKVAQIINEKELEFVNPIDIYSSKYKGKMHYFKDEIGRLDLCVTPNHRMYYRNVKKNKYFVERSYNLKWNQNKEHLISAVKKGNLTNLTNEEKIWIAYQADGQSLRYDGTKTGRIVNQIRVLKERKKEKLRDLLSKSYYKWEEVLYERNGDIYSNFKIYSDTPIPKHFDWINIENISTEWAFEFVEELKHWDCHIDCHDKIIYSNCNKEDCDIVQTIAFMTGKYVTRSVYKDTRKETYSDVHKIQIQLNKEGFVNGQSMKKSFSEIDYDGNIYCVTVPSGIIVTRRNFKISLSGNTETFVEDYWSSKVGKWFPKSEIKNMAHCFANMESIHADSYIFLNETLGLTDFDSFLNDESVMAKLDEIIEILDSNKQDIKSIAKSLVVFSVCTEGINLFSSFMILLSFKRKNKLQGVGQIVEFSCRDENLHSEAGCRLFNELIKEYPHIWTDELKGEIYTAVELAIKNEFHYINQIFGNRQLETISKDEVKNYMFYRANKKLKEIGLKEKYLVDNQLLEQTSWFEAFTKGSQRTDFFAQQETNYSKPKDDWSLLL
jgi:ribonucleoside-diphosphate reductase beta chain